MKSLFLTSILAAVALIAAAPSAEARPYRSYPRTTIVVTGYTSWGAPIRAERYFIRYGHHGHVVWGYRRLPVARPYYAPPRHHHHGYGYDRPVRYYDGGYR